MKPVDPLAANAEVKAVFKDIQETRKHSPRTIPPK